MRRILLRLAGILLVIGIVLVIGWGAFVKRATVLPSLTGPKPVGKVNLHLVDTNRKEQLGGSPDAR